MSILVTFFSPTGTTKKYAEEIAYELKADLFDIQPETPYTEGDLKWTNPLARCNKEKFKKLYVPYKGNISNFADYDTVFIGFPIWYYQEPNIIDSFLDDYNFTHKKVYLFATSGSSDIKRAEASVATKIASKVISAKLIRTSADVGEWRKQIAP